jgi:hypothetical protein
MPLYMIEREIPAAKNLTKDELQGIAQKSMCALEHIPGYRWDHSYVAGNKFYCVHEAKNEESVREHSRRGGFPILSITEIAAVVSPATAGEPAREKAAAAAPRPRAIAGG